MAGRFPVGRAAPCDGGNRRLSACGNCDAARGGTVPWLPASEVFASGAQRVCSMSGDGGGRASQIYRGGGGLLLGVGLG
jgi:hypothetical protein